MMFGGIDRIARRRLLFKAEAASRNYWQTVTGICERRICARKDIALFAIGITRNCPMSM